MNDFTNFSDMFNLDAEDFIQKSNESVLYKVSPKDGKGGVYNSLIRFIPWYKDPKNSELSKWESWLENPLTKKGMMVDCPSSVGKPSELRDLWNRLNYSSNEQLKSKAHHFSRRPQYYAIIQIIKDENRPELEGKLKIFKYGSKIYDKIQAELKPSFGEPHVPFHPFNGRPFNLKVKVVGGHNNYDESKFLDKAYPIMNGDVAFTPNNIDEMQKFLVENSPKLDEYAAYREWTEEIDNHFKEMVKVILPSKQSAASELLSSSETRQESNEFSFSKKTPSEDYTNLSNNEDEDKPNDLNPTPEFNFNDLDL